MKNLDLMTHTPKKTEEKIYTIPIVITSKSCQGSGVRLNK